MGYGASHRSQGNGVIEVITCNCGAVVGNIIDHYELWHGGVPKAKVRDYRVFLWDNGPGRPIKVEHRSEICDT